MDGTEGVALVVGAGRTVAVVGTEGVVLVFGAGRTVAVVGTEGGGIGGRCRKDSSSGRYRRGWYWFSVQEGQ